MLYNHIRQSDRVNNIHSVRFNFQPIADKRLGFLCYFLCPPSPAHRKKVAGGKIRPMFRSGCVIP